MFDSGVVHVAAPEPPMSQQPLRSRMFAAVAAFSGIGAAWAVNGADFIVLCDAPAPVAGAHARIDPNKPLKGRSVQTIALSQDPYSHMLRLAGLYPDTPGTSGQRETLSLSLASIWTGMPGVTDNANRADRPEARNPSNHHLEPQIVNLTFTVDAQYDAPWWGN